MAEYSNITRCSHCVHGDVCKYKEKYLEAVTALLKTWYGDVSSTPPLNRFSFAGEDFFEFKEPECKYFVNMHKV